MLKKFLYLTLVFLILIGFNPIIGEDDYSKDWELTKEDIQDALDLGRILTRWDDLVSLYFDNGLYSLFYRENKYDRFYDSILIITPFQRLVEASMMYFYANGKNLPEQDVEEIISEKELTIFLVTHGFDIDLANNCSCFIKTENKIISPIDVIISEPIGLESDWYEPKYRFSINFVFSLKDIPKKAVTIMVVKDSEVTQYEVDLSKLK